MFADATEHSLEEGDVSRKSIRLAFKHWLYNSMRKSGGSSGKNRAVDGCETQNGDCVASPGSSGRSLVVSTLTLSDSDSDSGSNSVKETQVGYTPEQLFSGKNSKNTRFRGSMREKLDRIKLSYTDFTQRSNNFPVPFLNSCGSEMDSCETGSLTSFPGVLGTLDSMAERRSNDNNNNNTSGSDGDRLSCYRSFRTGIEDLNVLFEYTMRNGLSSGGSYGTNYDNCDIGIGDIDMSSVMFAGSDRSVNPGLYTTTGGKRGKSRSTPFKALIYEDLQRDDSELLDIISRCTEVAEEEPQGSGKFVGSEVESLGSMGASTKHTGNELNIQTGLDSGDVLSSKGTTSSLAVCEVPPSRQYDENIVLYVDTGMNFSTDSSKLFPRLGGHLREPQENCKIEHRDVSSDCEYSQISESQTSAYSITSESSCSTMSSGDLTSSVQSSREPSSEIYCIPTFRETNSRRLSVSGIISTLKSGEVTERDLGKLVEKLTLCGAKRKKLEYQGSAFYDELPENYFEGVSVNNSNNNNNNDTTEDSLSSDLGFNDVSDSKSKNCSVRFYDKSQLLVYGPQGGTKRDNGETLSTLEPLTTHRDRGVVKSGGLKEPLSVRSILKRKENIRSDIELKVAQSCDAVDVKSFLRSFKYYEKIKSNEHERYSRIRESQMERYYSWERSGSWTGKNRR